MDSALSKWCVTEVILFRNTLISQQLWILCTESCYFSVDWWEVDPDPTLPQTKLKSTSCLPQLLPFNITQNYLVIKGVFNHNYYHAVKGQNEAFPLFVMISPIINPCQASTNITVLLLWAKWKVMAIESEIKGYKWNWVFPAWGHLEDWDCNHYCCGWQRVK